MPMVIVAFVGLAADVAWPRRPFGGISNARLRLVVGCGSRLWLERSRLKVVCARCMLTTHVRRFTSMFDVLSDTQPGSGVRRLRAVHRMLVVVGHSFREELYHIFLAESSLSHVIKLVFGVGFDVFVVLIFTAMGHDERRWTDFRKAVYH